MSMVTLVIPVHNEAQSLETLVASLRKLLAARIGVEEVVLVDDGSTDDSAAILRGLLDADDRLRLVSHDRNRGYGAALKTGIAAARHDLIAIADADGTYPLAALRPLIEAVHGGARMAVGARRLADQPAGRRPAKVFLNKFASYLSGTRIPDINSGLRVFHREDATRFRRMLPDGFSFTTTITMALLGEGHRVAFLPIKYRERTGRSKIQPVRDMGRFLVLICRMALTFEPLRIFLPVGGVLIAAGCVLLLARLFVEFGLATTLVLWVAGLQIWAVGFLADLINRRS